METLSIEKFHVVDEKSHVKQMEYVSSITLEREKPPPPLAVEVLASGKRALASLQDGIKLLTLGVPCMIQEMREEDVYAKERG